MVGVVVWRLYEQDQFEYELWEPFVTPIYMEALLRGLWETLQMAFLSIIFAVGFGLIFGVGKLSDHAWLRWPCWVVVEFFRAVPVLLLMVFIYFTYGVGDGFGSYWAVVIALTLYNGSVLAEVFRAGINAVPKGQTEASYAIGMRKNQVMRLVLIPQSITIMLPAIISQCVIVLKDTALGLIIAYQDLVAEGQRIAEFVNASVVPLGLIAVIYIAMNYALSRLAVTLEHRMSRRGRSSAKKVVDQSDPELNPGGGGSGA